jgi:hypothetical protein
MEAECEMYDDDSDSYHSGDDGDDGWECDICNTQFAEGEVQFVHLPCHHSYCIDCAVQYVQLGAPSRKLTFNHLYCPFRCGTAFQSDPTAMTHLELGATITAQTAIMEKVNDLALQHLRQSRSGAKALKELDGLSEAELRQRAMDEASFYMCDVCEDVFWQEEVCSASGSQDEQEYLCAKCKKHSLSSSKTTSRRRQISPAISLWKEQQRKVDSFFGIRSSSLLFESPETCNSEYNAAEQFSELEVLQSIYPESVEVMTPPPTAVGQPCAVYVFQIPATELMSSSQNAEEVIIYLQRLQSQIRIVFKCTSGYPSVSAPVVLLQIGELSLLELTSSMKKALSDSLVS